MSEYFQAVYGQDHRAQWKTLLVEMINLSIAEIEAKDSLNQMNGSRTAGPDGLYPAIVQQPAEILMKPFTLVFNISLDEGLFPGNWLTSSVMLVH